jgi:hypothetical protein
MRGDQTTRPRIPATIALDNFLGCRAREVKILQRVRVALAPKERAGLEKHALGAVLSDCRARSAPRPTLGLIRVDATQWHPLQASTTAALVRLQSNDVCQADGPEIRLLAGRASHLLPPDEYRSYSGGRRLGRVRHVTMPTDQDESLLWEQPRQGEIVLAGNQWRCQVDCESEQAAADWVERRA